jgi:hypothetical protein
VTSVPVTKGSVSFRMTYTSASDEVLKIAAISTGFLAFFQDAVIPQLIPEVGWGAPTI